MLWPIQIFLFAVLPIAVLGVLVALKRLSDTNPTLQRLSNWLSAMLALCALLVMGGVAFYDNEAGGIYADRALAMRAAFSLSDDVKFGHINKLHRSPVCWWPDTNIEGKATFPDNVSFEEYQIRALDQSALVEHIATFFDVPANKIAVEEGAFEWRRMDTRYSVNGDGKEWNVRYRRFFGGPHLCVAIDRGLAIENRITMRRCDALAEPKDRGDLGRVIAVLNSNRNMLDANISLQGTPASCRNSVRASFNSLIGIPK